VRPVFGRKSACFGKQLNYRNELLNILAAPLLSFEIVAELFALCNLPHAECLEGANLLRPRLRGLEDLDVVPRSGLLDSALCPSVWDAHRERKAFLKPDLRQEQGDGFTGAKPNFFEHGLGATLELGFNPRPDSCCLAHLSHPFGVHGITCTTKGVVAQTGYNLNQEFNC
jgi:hypothetical protein